MTPVYLLRIVLGVKIIRESNNARCFVAQSNIQLRSPMIFLQFLIKFPPQWNCFPL